MSKFSHFSRQVKHVHMYSRFTFVENTIRNSPKVTRVKFQGTNNGLFCCIGICKFGSFKNPFAMITSLSEIYFRSRRFILLWKMTKWFLWAMAAAQAAENQGDEWGLTWYFLWGTYTSIPTWTHSQTSLAAAEAPSLRSTNLPWNISQMIMKTTPISTRTVISYAMKQGILLWISWKVNENWDNNMIRISQWRESHCRTNTSVRRKK